MRGDLGVLGVDVDRAIKYAMDSARRRERTLRVWRLDGAVGVSLHEPDGAKLIGRAVWREDCMCVRWEPAF